MNAVRGVIFDMDGLMFDSESICYQAYMRAAQRFGFQVNERVHLDLSGRSEQDILLELGRLYGDDKDIALWRAYIKGQRAEIIAQQGGKVGKKAGLLELLSYLHERSIPFAMASSSPRATIDSYLRAEYLSHEFGDSNIVDSSQVHACKPDPEVFQRAAELIDERPENVIVLEDSRAGIRAANRGGFISCFVHDDLSRAGAIEEGAPILVELDGIETMRDEAAHCLETLSDAIGLIEQSRV